MPHWRPLATMRPGPVMSWPRLRSLLRRFPYRLVSTKVIAQDRDERARLLEAVARRKSIIARLESKAAKDSARHRRDLAALVRDLAATKTDFSDLAVRFEEVRASRALLFRQAKELSRTLGTANAAVENLTARLDEALASHTSLFRQNRQHGKDLAAVEARLSAARAELESLSATVAGARALMNDVGLRPIRAPRGAGRRERHIICTRPDGLGARLSNLLWTWRIARRLDARVLMFWPPMDPHYGEEVRVGDLLDTFELATHPLRGELQIVESACDEHFRPKHLNLYRKTSHDPLDLVTMLPAERRSPRPSSVIASWRGPFLMPGESASAALAEIPPLFAKLPVQREIRIAVERAARHIDFTRTVAVHVRRGDIPDLMITACAAWNAGEEGDREMLEKRIGAFLMRCAPLQTYVRLTRPFVKQRFKILFFSDSPQVAEELSERIGRRLLMAQTFSSKEFTDIQRAFFELLLMSRCPVVIGAKSAFGTLAATAGGGRFVDAQLDTRPEELIGAVWEHLDPLCLSPQARATISDVIFRVILRLDVMDRWQTAPEEILNMVGSYSRAA